MPKILRRAGGRRLISARAASSTGGVWCLLPDEARVPLRRRRRRRLSTRIKFSPFLIIYDERRVDFSSPCLCLIKSAVLNVCMFWYSASGGADDVTSWLVPLPSLFFREEWRPTRRQTFSMNPYFRSSHYVLFAGAIPLNESTVITRACTNLFRIRILCMVCYHCWF